MKCLGRTASGARCRRERAPRRLTCEEHSLWKTFWKGVLALSVVVSLLGGAVALADRFGLFSTPAPTTADECLEQSDSSTARELMIAGWLCETEFANIWAPDRRLEVLEENRGLLDDQFDRILHGSVGEEAGPSPAALADEGLRGGRVSRLYANWPRYRDEPALVLGSVRSAQNILDDEVSSDWVFQLGTVRDDHVLIYLRVSGPPGWTPPPESECPLALAEGIPIARGSVPRADGDGAFDVIYSMSSFFTCLSDIEDEDVRDSLPPELRRAFDEGASLDRW